MKTSDLSSALQHLVSVLEFIPDCFRFLLPSLCIFGVIFWAHFFFSFLGGSHHLGFLLNRLDRDFD